MRTILILTAFTLAANGGVVRPKYQSSTEEDPENVAALTGWPEKGMNEPKVMYLMQYGRNQLETTENQEAAAQSTYFAPMHAYEDDYHFAGAGNGQHHEHSYLDHQGYDDHTERYLNDLLALKVKETTVAAEARSKEAAEKEDILAKWKAEEADLVNKLAEQQAKFDALRIQYEVGKHKKSTQETKNTGKDISTSMWEPMMKKEDMMLLQAKPYSENLEKGTDSFSTVMEKKPGEGKAQYHLPALIKTNDEYHAAIENNMGEEIGKINTLSADYGKTYDNHATDITLLKEKNQLASFTPSQVSSELTKPYEGPLASILVLPSGYLADTDEVFAAKQSHLRALMEAESAASKWEKHAE